jgi:hypothetical protein
MIRLRAGKLQRLGPGRHLGQDDPLRADAAMQRVQRPWIGDVGAGRHHGDRRTAGRERAFVRGGVNTERHPADDRNPARRQLATERAGDFEAV